MIGISIYCNPVKQGYCDLRIVVCEMKINTAIRIIHCILPQGQHGIENQELMITSKLFMSIQ